MRTTQIRRDRTELRTLIVPGLQGSGPALLVAHSYGCLAAVHAGARLEHRIRGALLVAPPEPARFGAATALRGARPGSRWVVVASRNDPWMPFERARAWAATWSSRFVDAGAAVHLNADAGCGEWAAGERLADQLRHEALDIDSCAVRPRPMRSIAA